VVLDDGHVDLIAPRLEDGVLRTRVKDGTAGPDKAVWRDPADLVVHLVPQARNTIPADPAYAFLGDAGQPVWLIPQTQIPGIVWAGWNTESLRPEHGDVTITLSAVDGPGRLAVFLTGLTPTVLVNSADGLPDALTVAPGTHAHANWAFTREGIYRITVEVAVTPAGGQRVVDTDEYAIAVGDVDPTTALGRDCTTPTDTTSPTTTSPTGTVPPTTTTAAASGGSRLANTGAGSLGTVLAVGALLLTGGAALSLLTRSRRRGLDG
jgi:surface-anchored protein